MHYYKGDSESMKCPNCSSQLSEDMEFCPECGKAIDSSKQKLNGSGKYYCNNCKEELEYISAYKQWYCYNCQNYVDLPEPKKESDSKQDIISEDGEELEISEDDATPISWDDEPIKIDSEIGDSEEIESEPQSIDRSEIEESDQQEAVEDVGWDDTVEADDNESSFIIEGEVISDQDEDVTVEIADDSEQDLELEQKPSTGDDDESPKEPIIAGPIAGVEPGVDIIENLSADQVVVEIDQDYAPVEETIEITDHTQIPESDVETSRLRKIAVNKLHKAWVKVTNLKGLNPKDPRVLQLGDDLKSALEGNFDPRDCIILAEESIEEAEKLEKELKDNIHRGVSDMFHFINSKIILAKKIGFNVEQLEEELDNVTSLIARSEYHRARFELETCLKKILDLEVTDHYFSFQENTL